MKKVTTILFVLYSISFFGQVEEFNMADSLTTECAGILYDSGGPGQIYENNEEFTFTVETGGDITVTFIGEFCLDNLFDFLSVYDGPDTSSPLIGTYTGTTTPSNFTATSGFVTFYFTSDPNAAYCGWHIEWSTEVTPPPEPLFEFDEPIACGENVTLFFDVNNEIPVWAMEDAEFTVTSALNHEVDDWIINAGEFVSEVELVFDEPLDYNCDYLVVMDILLPDQCDSLWEFQVQNTFQLNTCPLNAILEVENDSICEGNCMEIFLNIPSADCYTYDFSWTPVLPNTEGPHIICPETSGNYSVNITEIETGNTFMESIFITVTEGQTNQEDVTLCASEGPFELLIEEPGAYWYGTGIVDELNGVFDPDSAFVGSNIVYYAASSVCIDSIEIQILPIDAGGVIAACPGTGPFDLSPFPPGGTWDGPNVTIDGIFDPSAIGSFELHYTLETCIDTLIVNVDDIGLNTDLGIRCQSDYEEGIPFSPFGGTWSGEGIIDENWGVFDPGEMSAGVHQFEYEIIGCNQFVDIEILPIYVGGHWQNSCPDQDPFIPFSDWSPTGGYWEGLGITDTDNFIYDPGIVGNDVWTNLLYYAPNGCVDTIYMYNVYTQIGVDTAHFCIEDEDFFLDYETIGRTPWGGVWSGASFYWETDVGDFFSPSSSGVGQHQITYSNNGCTDNAVFIVYPSELPLDTLSFCSNDPPVELFPNVPKGAPWVGDGIIDSYQGIFDPSIATDDDFYIYWNSPGNCIDSVFILIEEFEPATILGLEELYCFQDQNYEIELEPSGGLWTGSSTQDFFNPALEGTGFYELVYVYETELCYSTDTMNIEVYPLIEGELVADDEIICPGESTIIEVTSNGGAPETLYSYQWSNDLFPISSNTVIPEESTTYYIAVYDGCSDPYIDSIYIEVLPPIEVQIATNDTVCYGENGFVTAEVLNDGDFEIAWGFNSDIFTDTLDVIAGNSTQLLVTDQENGCSFDSIFFTPSYTPISALFTVNPNEDCIPEEFNPVTFIDLSEHGVTGFWSFGNGEIEPYDPNVNPQMEYLADSYTVYLFIENEGGCPDTSSVDICVLAASRIFIPDIFSPNEDSNNDLLFVRGRGINEMEFEVFDRWGEMVFKSNDPDNGWDGKFKGKEMPSGVYFYRLGVVLNNGERLNLSGNISLVR